jgi:hypothetical protein
MSIDQIKNEFEELKNTPEFAKYRRYGFFALIGLIIIFCGFISAIIYNAIAGNEPGTWVMPLFSIIIFVVGIGFFIIYVIGTSLVPREFRYRLRVLKTKLKLNKIKERKNPK